MKLRDVLHALVDQLSQDWDLAEMHAAVDEAFEAAEAPAKSAKSAKAPETPAA